MLLVPLLHCPGGAAQLHCFFTHELPLVLAQPPALIHISRKDPHLVVELHREPESSGKAASGDA